MTYICRSCGKDISEQQYAQFDKLCPECTHIEKHKATGETCYICSKLTLTTCACCNKPICAEHQKIIPKWLELLCPKCYDRIILRRVILALVGFSVIIMIMILGSTNVFK